ncbi:MAG: hypothetical protein DDT19_01998 [Syntrophomonadaceae bacterium]|nr:hypothetical protein [Bacillota bacterium]
MGILDNESNRVVFNQGVHLSFKVQTAMYNQSQKFFLRAKQKRDRIKIVNDDELHFAKPRGAPQRAERNEFSSQNALGGAKRRP